MLKSKFPKRLKSSVFFLYLLVMMNLSIIAQIPPTKLEPNQSIEREITDAETHRYKFELKPNEFFQVRVEQKGVDVMLKLLDAKETVLAMMDGLNEKEGFETLSYIPDKNGKFVIEVSRFDEKAEKGNYAINRIISRTATSLDKKRVETECLFMEGLKSRNTEEQSEIAITRLEQALNGWRELKNEYLIKLTARKIDQIKKTKADAVFKEALAFVEQGTPESYQSALEKYQQAGKIYEEIDDKSEKVGISWLGAGIISYNSGKIQEALRFYDKALISFQENNKYLEMMTLNNIGDIYLELEEKRPALEVFNQALSLSRLIEDKSEEATILTNIASIYDSLGEKQKALEYFNQVLVIKKAIGDMPGEAATLTTIGEIYNSLGEKQKTLEYLNQSLSLSKLIGDKLREARTLNNIGGVYDLLGEDQKALEYFNQALLLNEIVGDKFIRAASLNNIGSIYNSLGENQKALDYYSQSLPLSKYLGDASGEAKTLNNIGGLYDSLGNKQKALEYYNQAWISSKSANDKQGEAAALNNIGSIYISLGEQQRALEYFTQALKLSKFIEDKLLEAATLANIGVVYRALGEKKEALEYFQTSLRLSRYTNNISQQAIILSQLRQYWHSLKNPGLAIFYGKQSVNLYQKIRKNIQGLNKDTQKTYLSSIENSYRKLADILIAQGRIAEAEQVLDMLKEEEFFSYLRRDSNVANRLDSRVALTPEERQAIGDYEKYANEVTRAAEELGVLEKKKNDPKSLGKSLLSAEEEKRYDELKRIYNLAVERFTKFLDELKLIFGKEDKRIVQVESSLLTFLKKLNEPRSVIISTIIGEDRLNLIVTTSDVQKAYQVNISAANLNKLVVEFRNAVRNPAVDPRSFSKRLYDRLFPAGLKKDLNNIKADTIIWSLDGTLRYVPVAALFDGERYLVEHYNQAVITFASRDKLEKSVNAAREKWLAFGIGVSKPYENFPALPAVPQELCSVVSDARQKFFCERFQTKGVFDGLMYADEDFTTKNFEDNIGKVSVVHIASHFDLQPGNDNDSYLLLGGGDERKYSLDRFSKLKEDSLVNIELLTLSACNTAMTAGNKSNGVEIEGFGALAQNKGVKSVLATLWAVNDSSTGLLMTEFYKRLKENPTDGKARAMRSAQLKLIQGDYKTLREAVANRSELIDLNNRNKNQPVFKKDDKAPFSHPFYWSPFVLSGNWR